jgi:putative peptidoglycan lipid II flippase
MAASSSRRVAPLLWGMTALARAASAAKELLLALALGTTPWKDALVVAWTAPTLIAAYSNETLPALLTPLWAGGHSSPAARRLVVLALAALAALSAAAVVWPSALVRVLAPALPPPALGAAIALERLLAVNIVLLGAATLLAARLNADRRFGWAPLGAGLPALGAVVAVGLSPGAPPALRVLDVGWGLTAGSAAALLILIAAWRLPPRLLALPAPPVNGSFAVLGRSLAALLAAMLVINLVPVAERMAASGLRSGSLAAYDYGERLVRFVFGLSVAPFTALSFTRLSELARQPGADFASHAQSCLRALLILAAPLAVVLAVFAPLLTRCVYGWGRFGHASLLATFPVVAIQGGGLALDAAIYFLLFAGFARGDAAAKLPLALALAAVNIPLAFLWARAFGLPGLAAAHVAGAAAALAWVGWRERGGARTPRGGPRPAMSWRPALPAAVSAAGITLVAALAVRALLPPLVQAGQRSTLASWAWLAAALALTAALAGVLARWFAPQLLRDWQGALAGVDLPPAAAELAQAL